MPEKYEARRAPDTIADQTNLQAWKDLFMARRTWALEQVEECAKMSDMAQLRYDEIDVITRSVGAAVNNLRTHVETLDQRCTDARDWGIERSKEHHALVDGVDQFLAQLRSLPATTPMIRFIVGRDPRRGKAQANLDDLIDVDEVENARSTAQKAATTFGKNITDLLHALEKVVSKTDKLLDSAENGVAKSASQQSQESIQLMEDIEAIAKKVNNDYESVLGYSNTPKSVSQASKSALLHTKNFLPNLSKRSLEMDGILKYATEMRNAAVTESMELMQTVTYLNSMLPEISHRLEAVDLSPDEEKAFGLLQGVQKMPAIYASFVAESIRRREWSEKVKGDSSTLANEMATFQDEEDRRRKKWQKTTGAFFWADKKEGKAMGLEINLLGDDEQWPMASRQELEELLAKMESQKAPPEMIAEVSQVITDLNNPTKQQSKRAKAFKNGSFHEAALGRSTLLVRGDDDLIRNLQQEKARIEGKLKGSESRVRRLEDLLHRQSHVSRTSTGNIFQVPSSPVPESAISMTPRLNDNLSRRSSVSSRRFSANLGPDEKVVAQKLISLEAELIAERERAAGLEKEISARTTTTDNFKTQMEEANSTKKDLMENLEAQQNEFAVERKSLESELKRLKTRLEEYEDDMDRILGSRENEKATVDERVRSLQKEVDRLREDSEAQTQKAQGQVDFLRNDAKMQRETNDNLESQLQRTKDDNKELKSRAERAELAEASQIDTLHGLHALLIPNTAIPDNEAHLVEGLFGKSRDVVSELEVHKNGLTMAQADRDTAQALVTGLRGELSDAKDKLAIEEMETFQLRETLGAERAKFQALETELGDEREQLTTLRAKFADGETGSEALRSRVQEEEKKVTELSEELAAKRSQVGSLEEELRSFQDRLQASQSKFDKLTSRFESRTLRAKDLTQRLYAQNDRLCRLLDRLSYSVTREGDSMLIQRIPRTERVSANDSSDPGSSVMRKSISGILPKKAMADSGDLDLLYWMQNEDSETESEKYDAYLKAIGYFDIEGFSETITRRVKDLEHTARKYTKDARAYREKSHHAQKEAHEKIAFKNFKDGDLALFLPTRNQTAGAWAAFNVGAPHYFLREQDAHKLRSRDWLLARIHKIEDRVVDLSKSMTGHHSNLGDRGSIGEASNGGDSFDDDNPFDLSDGLRWYLVDATEEKPGAPSTPGLGKSTVATAAVEATGSIRRTKKTSTSGVEGVSKSLSRSLDSRRSSSNSKKAAPAGSSSGTPKAPSLLSDSSKPLLTPAAGPSTEITIVGSPTPTGDRPRLGHGETPPQLLATGSNVEVRQSPSPHEIDNLLGP